MASASFNATNISRRSGMNSMWILEPPRGLTQNPNHEYTLLRGELAVIITLTLFCHVRSANDLEVAGGINRTGHHRTLATVSMQIMLRRPVSCQPEVIFFEFQWFLF